MLDFRERRGRARGNVAVHAFTATGVRVCYNASVGSSFGEAERQQLDPSYLDLALVKVAATEHRPSRRRSARLLPVARPGDGAVEPSSRGKAGKDYCASHGAWLKKALFSSLCGSAKCSSQPPGSQTYMMRQPHSATAGSAIFTPGYFWSSASVWR